MRAKLKNRSIILISDSLNSRVTDQSERVGKTLWGCTTSCLSLLSFLQLGFDFPDSSTLQPVLVLLKLLRRYHWAREPRKRVALLMPLFSGWEINTWETSLGTKLFNCSTIDIQWSVRLNTTEIRIWWMQWVGWKAEKSGFQLVYGHVKTWKRFINQMETEDENSCLFRFSFILCSEVPLYYCGAPKEGTTPFHFLWELCLL